MMSDPKALLNIVKNNQPSHQVKSESTSKMGSKISKKPPPPPSKMKPITKGTAMGLSQLQSALSKPPPPPPPRSRVNPNEHSSAPHHLETTQVIKRGPPNKLNHERCNVDSDELEDIQKDLHSLIASLDQL